MPNHSLIFFCLVPFWVSHLRKQSGTGSSIRPKLHLSSATVGICAHIKYCSRILRSCMRSGLRLFIFLSISLLSDTCCLRSCSSFRLLSWISFTRDFRRSELLWILGRRNHKDGFWNVFFKRWRKAEIWKRSFTSGSLSRCLPVGSAPKTPCCSAPGSHTVPQRS